MDTKRGFTLVELMIVVAILGILAAIAIPEYLHYMQGAKVTAAVENFDNLVRLAGFEASKRSIVGLDGPANVLAVVDPGYGTATAQKSPMDNALPAYAIGAAPAGDGQVVVDVANFQRASNPPATIVTIRADVTNDGVASVDRIYTLTLE